MLASEFASLETLKRDYKQNKLLPKVRL